MATHSRAMPGLIFINSNLICLLPMVMFLSVIDMTFTELLADHEAQAVGLDRVGEMLGFSRGAQDWLECLGSVRDQFFHAKTGHFSEGRVVGNLSLQFVHDLS